LQIVRMRWVGSDDIAFRNAVESFHRIARRHCAALSLRRAACRKALFGGSRCVPAAVAAASALSIEIFRRARFNHVAIAPHRRYIACVRSA
jgi:hypothetical protein